MEIYLVGGAVRDELLGLAVVERDWVVVGALPEELLQLGYRQVGRDFPVFLHPETGEEYALARTERKTGPGHQGFVCHAGREVTLEQDLERRDLTINAIARGTDGRLIDPFGGQRDLEQRVLRHVSAAFSEDPLRVYRVARLAAQLADFYVAEETRTLMQTMAARDELAELAPERVWEELRKALGCDQPERFFAVLGDADAWQPWLSEFAGASIALPPELQQPLERFAALVSLFGDATVTALCQRLRTPRRYLNLARNVARFGHLFATWREQSADDVHAALKSVGAFKTTSDLTSMWRVVEACHGEDTAQLIGLAERLRDDVRASQFASVGLTGRELGEAMDDARVRGLKSAAGDGPGR